MTEDLGSFTSIFISDFFEDNSVFISDLIVCFGTSGTSCSSSESLSRRSITSTPTFLLATTLTSNTSTSWVEKFSALCCWSCCDASPMLAEAVSLQLFSALCCCINDSESLSMFSSLSASFCCCCFCSTAFDLFFDVLNRLGVLGNLSLCPPNVKHGRFFIFAGDFFLLLFLEWSSCLLLIVICSVNIDSWEDSPPPPRMLMSCSSDLAVPVSFASDGSLLAADHFSKLNPFWPCKTSVGTWSTCLLSLSLFPSRRLGGNSIGNSCDKYWKSPMV